jgi:hypothetical protein
MLYQLFLFQYAPCLLDIQKCFTTTWIVCPELVSNVSGITRKTVFKMHMKYSNNSKPFPFGAAVLML